MKNFLSFLMASLLLVSPANALTESQLDFFAQNDIFFYNPDSLNIYGQTCYSGMLNGNAITEMVIDYFSGNNRHGIVLTANGIAGILANFAHESGLSPFRNQGQYDNNDNIDHMLPQNGYGIAQFTPRDKITNLLASDNRTKNFYNDYYKQEYGGLPTDSGIPVGISADVAKAWLEVQLDYISANELQSTKVGQYRNIGGSMGLDYISDDSTILEALNNAKSSADAARIFVWIYERPDKKDEAALVRSENAQNYLNKVLAYSGSSIQANATTNVDGSNILYVSSGSDDEVKNTLSSNLEGITIIDANSNFIETIKNNLSSDEYKTKTIITNVFGYEDIDVDELNSTIINSTTKQIYIIENTENEGIKNAFLNIKKDNVTIILAQGKEAANQTISTLRAKSITINQCSSNTSNTSNTQSAGCYDGTISLGYYNNAHSRGQQLPPIELCEITNFATTNGKNFQYTSSNNHIVVSAKASKSFYEFANTLSRQGITISASSSFRTFEYQNCLYYGTYQGETCNGASAAEPGHSNHESGLAVDININSINTKIKETLSEAKQNCINIGALSSSMGELTDIGNSSENRWTTSLSLCEVMAQYKLQFKVSSEPWHIEYIGE